MSVHGGQTVLADIAKRQMGKKEMREKPALLIIDMVKDTFDDAHPLPITPFGRQIIEPINGLIRGFRKQAWPIVFSTDAFHRDDFIFKGRMKPHSLAGTQGAEVIDELDRQPEDLWLPKPRFSAFFGTTLDEWLKARGVTLCAVAGLATNFCVLTTVMDALCHDFKAVFLEDCTATWSEEVHQQVLNNYRRNPLDPLLRVLSAQQLVDTLGMD
ncbi:cysteine hydrolase family protein [Desulfosarcina ovata]|nr:isochorismatase family cysteine hydrolase [Desulfosarcina ovata]